MSQITIQLTNDPLTGLPRYATLTNFIISDLTDWYTIQYVEQVKNLNGDVVKEDYKSVSGGDPNQYSVFLSQTLIEEIENFMTNNIS